MGFALCCSFVTQTLACRHAHEGRAARLWWHLSPPPPAQPEAAHDPGSRRSRSPASTARAASSGQGQISEGQTSAESWNNLASVAAPSARFPRTGAGSSSPLPSPVRARNCSGTCEHAGSLWLLCSHLLRPSFGWGRALRSDKWFVRRLRVSCLSAYLLLVCDTPLGNRRRHAHRRGGRCRPHGSATPNKRRGPPWHAQRP
jgi:hypothetical protein